MKQSFAISQLTTDKTLLFAQRYEILKRRLSKICANIENNIIKYDDSITDKQDIEDIICQILEINANTR